jgi:FKBP-type peptidyl-prolyl cis-trans isomerase (trigger factor)
MTYTKKIEKDNSILLTITFPWKIVESTREEVKEKTIKEVEVDGFRKGKAPKKIAQQYVDTGKLYENTILQLIPDAYKEILTKEKIRPIVEPEITLSKAKEGEDWVIDIKTCEIPEVIVGDYKKAIQDEKKKSSLWVPGKKEEKEPEEKKKTLDDVIPIFLSVCKATIPSVLVDHEVTKMLSDLVDRTKQLGMSIEQYAKAKNTTIEALKSDYRKSASDSVLFELAWQKVADSAQITVEDKEFDALLAGATSDEEKKSLESNRYYLSHILRRKKTMDYLLSL